MGLLKVKLSIKYLDKGPHRIAIASPSRVLKLLLTHTHPFALAGLLKFAWTDRDENENVHLFNSFGKPLLASFESYINIHCKT